MEKTDLFRDPTRFLALGQFLLADSGYAAKWFVCTPYTKPLSEEAHNGLFNELFSRARVLIEHVNGILKARWQCLKGLRNQMRTTKELASICQHIIACLVLHNLMIDFDDDWEEEDIPIEEGIARHLLDVEDVDRMTGNELRERVQEHLLAWHFEV
jgi:hypothetical protein